MRRDSCQTAVDKVTASDEPNCRHLLRVYVLGSDDALYFGHKDIPAHVLDVQGRFISAQNISITKSNMSRTGVTVDVVW